MVCHLCQAILREGVREVCHKETLAMFKLPAYDPVGIAMMGFGVLVVVALAFVF